MFKYNIFLLLDRPEMILFMFGRLGSKLIYIFIHLLIYTTPATLIWTSLSTKHYVFTVQDVVLENRILKYYGLILNLSLSNIE